MSGITKAEHAERMHEWIAGGAESDYRADMAVYSRLFEAVRQGHAWGGIVCALVPRLLDAIMPATGDDPEAIVAYMMTMAVLHAGERALKE